MVDLITIALLSKIFTVLTTSNLNDNVNIIFISCVLIIILRPYIIFFLRKYLSWLIKNMMTSAR